jgi:uncharacterized membrane protein YfcA
MFRAGSFVGPVLGAWVIHQYSVTEVFYLPLILCGITAVLLLSTKSEKDVIKSTSSIAATYHVAKREWKKLATLGVASSILSALRGTRMVGLPLIALALNLPVEQASLFIGIAGALDFALFYLRGVAPKEVKSSDIYWGALPWVGLQLIMVAVVIAFPALVTTLLDKPAAVVQSEDYNFTNSEDSKSEASSSKVDEDAPVTFQLDKPVK